MTTHDLRPASPLVTLRRMMPIEFASWRTRSIDSYAADMALATGGSLESARQRAEDQFPSMLPLGVETPGTWLCVVINGDGRDVGTIWAGPHPHRPSAAYVYDVEIDEELRGRGYGRAAMLAVERIVRDAGFSQIGLSVFGFNEVASRLYDAIGYRVVASEMTKSLQGGGVE